MGIVPPKAYIMPEEADLVYYMYQGITIPTWLRWYDWIVSALPTYQHTVVSDVTILSLVKLL
jgi:hypothetical protein